MATPFTAFVVTQAAAIAAFNATINASYTWWLWSPLDTLSLIVFATGTLTRELVPDDYDFIGIAD